MRGCEDSWAVQGPTSWSGTTLPSLLPSSSHSIPAGPFVSPGQARLEAADPPVQGALLLGESAIP